MTFVRLNPLSNDSQAYGFEMLGDAECWEWRGGKCLGYGRVRIGTKTVGAHRMVLEVFGAPVPPRSEIHHRCANRACVNPSHLQLCATTKEHFAADAAHQANIEAIVERRLAKTVCRHGHSMEDAYHDKEGRRCRTCDRQRHRRRDRRKLR